MIRLFSNRICCLLVSQRPFAPSAFSRSLSSRGFSSLGSHQQQSSYGFNKFRYTPGSTTDDNGEQRERGGNRRRYYSKNQQDHEHDRRAGGGDDQRRTRSGKSTGGGALFFVQAGIWSTLNYHLGWNKEDIRDKPIKEKIVIAAAYCREEKYDDALTVLHEALYLSEQQRSDNAINYCVDMMANIYYYIGRYEEAERAFADLIQRIIAGGTIDGVPAQTSPAVVELSLKLADVYAMKGEHDKAESGFQYCVETQKANLEKALSEHRRKHIKSPGTTWHDYQKNPDSTDPFALYGLVLETYARYLVRRGRIDDSQIYINRALEMAFEIYGALHSHTLAVMNNYALLCLHHGRYDVAAHYLKDVVTRAPMLDDNEAGEYVVGYYTNYAEALWHIGRHEEAMDYARRAEKVASNKSISDESRQRTAKYVNSLEADWNKGNRKKN